ncbi:amino acid adenylation domain-containing protein [Aquimarina rhabdastrellae]
MSNIKNKIVTNYWKSKLKNRLMINRKDQSEIFSQSISIFSDELWYFESLSGNNKMAEQTILLTLFSSLLQRYKLHSDIIYSKEEVKGKETPILYNVETIQGKGLKEYLNEIKKETLEVYNNIDSNYFFNNEFEKYSSIGFIYNQLTYNKELFDFSIGIEKTKVNLNITLHYSKSFISESLAKHFLANFKEWLINLDSSLNKNIDILPIISEEEKNMFLTSFNDNNYPYDKNDTLISVLEKQVKKTPQEIAVQYEKVQYTYEELNQEVNQLANFIVEKQNVKRGDHLGIKLPRNEKIIVAILAALKLNATYVPIDIDYPEERIRFIENDSKCTYIIDEEQFNRFETNQERYSKSNLDIEIDSTDVAYIIYTSGTTGVPKGVMITHQNAIALLNWAQNEFDEQKFDVVFASTSYCFDLSVFEMFFPLSIGKSIRILDNALEIGDALQHHKKVLINTVPSSIRNIIENGYSLSNVSIINLAGEPFPVDIANTLNSLGIETRNLYGPSEDTTYSTVYKLDPKKEYVTSIPVGIPVSNTQVYILDECMQLLPIGIPGELYISGDGIAKGYLNRSELTSKKFITNPYQENKKMYDTGDMAKWTPDGNIEFLGRNDHQVKLRGYRIELGEIEKSILSFSEEIVQAITVVHSSEKNEFLVAYYVTKTPIDTESIKSFLDIRLPGYMIPGYLIALEKMPLTPNGKIDRKALEKLTLNRRITTEYIAPKNETEKVLVNIWQEVLSVEKVGVEDNFFHLGGHSLMVSQVIEKMHKTLNRGVAYKEFFEEPTIRGNVKKMGKKEYVAIPQASESISYPLTPSQNRLWILSQLEEGSLAYNMPTAVKVNGEIDFVLFEESFNKVIERHEVLRTNFKTNENGEVRQHVKDFENVNFRIESKDFSFESDKKQLVDNYLERFNSISFDLEKELLFRASLIKTEDKVFVFLLSIHHIIGDGWSTRLLISEIIEIYNSLINRETLKLPGLSIQYKDYAVWLSKELQKEEFVKQKDYWLKQLEGELPVLELPSFTTRPLIKTYNGKRITQNFSESFLNKLKAFSINNDATLFMTLMAGINTLLYRYTGQKDIILGTPIAGRKHVDLENQIGLYLNTLALRTKINRKDSFSDMVACQKEILLGAYEHQGFPFDHLAGQLNTKPDSSRSLLFDVLVVLQNQEQLTNINNTNHIKGIEISNYPFERRTSQFDVSFIFVENEGLELTIEFNTDIYDSRLINRMFSHLENVLIRCIDEPDTPIEEVNYLNTKEAEQLITSFNSTSTAKKEQTVISLFEEQVEKTPDAIAVVFRGVAYTYNEINDKSNQLAHYLREKKQVTKESNIGVMLERSVDSIITMIGVMKSGACYVPVEHQYPLNRINFILEDASMDLVLTKNDLLQEDEIVFNHFVYLDDLQLTKYAVSNPEKTNKLEDKSFVVYTSGSTGNPKGVIQTHRMLSNLIQWDIEKSGIETGLRFLQYASFSFDMSLQDSWFVLCSGGQLFVLEEELRLDFSGLASYIVDHKIEVLSFPFSALSNFFTNNGLNHLENHKIKHIISSGEQLTINQALHDFLAKYPKIKLHNHYGPSETHVVTYYTMSEEAGNITPYAPIGYPISNTDIYILDSQLLPVPIGIKGELYIGGENLGIGYINLPEETEKRFIHSPFKDNQRLYKTGDISYWKDDGSIIYVGRNDDQIKIRGYRIELQEIERVLVEHPNIQDAIVIVHTKETEKRICAYFIGENPEEISELKEYMSRYLPHYMIPLYFINLSAFPLTSNGKVDKKSLPNPIELGLSDTKEYIAPENKIQSILAEIWEEILGVQKIGITDNFFEKGGHSLLMVQVINAIYKKLGKRISFQDFFKYPNIKTLSHNLLESDYVPISTAPIATSYPLTPTQKRIWILSQLEGGALAYNMPAAVTIKGNLDVTAFEEVFNTLLKRHEILRTCFKMDEKGEIMQYVTPFEDVDFQIDKEDVSDQDNVEEAIEAVCKQKNEILFDLEQAPLLSSSIITSGENEYIFLLSLHHIIGDGWSIEVLISEIIKSYNALVQNQKPELPEIKVQYKDYSVWLNNELKSKKYKESEKYWLECFKGELPVLNLPSAKPRPVNQIFNGKELEYHFPDTLKSELIKFTQNNDVTLFMVLMAGVHILLHKHSGQKDLITGTPVAGREHPDLEHQIGAYLNTLPIRTKIDPQNSFWEFLQYQKNELIGAYDHQHYPLDELIGKLKLQRDVSRSVLFDVLIILQSQKQLHTINNQKELTGLDFSPYKYINTTSKFDISFKFVESDALTLTIEYNTDIYNKTLMDRMYIHLENILKEVLTNPEKQINSIDYLTTTEELELDRFNNTLVTGEESLTFLDVFKGQVDKKPEKLAVYDGVNQFTYKELNELSDKITSCLMVNHQEDKSPIAVVLDRSAFVLPVLLGILKVGRSYIPLDPTFPVERLRHIINDSKVELIIGDQKEEFDLETNATILSLEKLLKQASKTKPKDIPNISPKDSAYIIYTSGSTGTPKGVEIGHQSLLNFLLSMQQRPGLNEKDVLFSVTTYSFDISILEFFAPLITGGSVFIVDQKTLSDPNTILQKLEGVKPTVMQATPGFYQLLFHAGWKGSKELKVLCGGDLLSKSLAEKLINTSAEVWNMYGPTETTIWSSVKRIEHPTDASNIGSPINNTSFYIVDEFLNKVPIGVVGSLYIGGKGLAKGYYGNEQLTKDRFIESPFLENEVIYKTGDIGKWNADGEIEFLGRNDYQVKIRGYRIELGEIEAHINQIQEIKEVVVVAKRKNEEEAFLVAYVIPNEEGIDARMVVTELKKKLPSYMVPNTIIPIPEFPLTSNGKVDRKKLLNYIHEPQASTVEYISPRNEIEEKLVSIWKAVLDVNKIGVLEDFFEIGGNSLSATKIAGMIHKQFEIKISINDLLRSSILEEQATLIENNLLILKNRSKKTEEEGEIEMEKFSI